MRGYLSTHTYLIALGSNQRHPKYGNPRMVVEQAMRAIADDIGPLPARSPIVDTPPIGPSRRRYANAAAILETELAPRSLLASLKAIERQFGRRTAGQRWRQRVIDLDIVLWDGGMYVAPDLLVPHALFRERDFVLGPAVAIAPNWRDSMTGLTLRHLHHRLTRPRPLPR